MVLAPFFIAASAAVLGLLGSVHLLFTLYGNKLDPRDAVVAVPPRGIALANVLYATGLGLELLP